MGNQTGNKFKRSYVSNITLFDHIKLSVHVYIRRECKVSEESKLSENRSLHTLNLADCGSNYNK